MKRKRTEMVGDVLGMFLRENGLETPLLEYRAVQSWPQAAGSAIAAHTTACFVREQALWIEVRTPALRTQLSMMRQQLVRRLNDIVGSTIIYDLKFC